MELRDQEAAREGSAESVVRRELEHHEKLYSGFAQEHFSKPAVRALRTHLVAHILRRTGVGPSARVLSLGCGIGDTEILLAPHVGELVGVDISPAAVEQAHAYAAQAGLKNVRFLEGVTETLDFVPASFELIFGIFFLHHLPQPMLISLPARVRELLTPGGKFYSLDPNRFRLSGAVGKVFVPNLMAKYRTPDERELNPSEVGAMFRGAGFDCRISFYDFLSSPLAGLFPGWRSGYVASRWMDELAIRIPLLRRLGSNFELLATKPLFFLPIHLDDRR